jgi:predicted transcriptional regulator
MELENRIIVEHGVSIQIARMFGVTSAMVGKALHGKGNTELAKKIRHVALTQYGGKKIRFVKTEKKKS